MENITESAASKFDESRKALDIFLSRVGKTQGTAKDIVKVAKATDFDHVEIEKSLHAHQSDLQGPYGEFVKFRKAFEEGCKEAGVKPRKSPVPGGSRRSPSDLSGMSADDLALDTIRLLNSIPSTIATAMAKGQELLKDMAEITEGLEGDALEALVSKLVTTRYFQFRDEVYMIFGLIGGVVKRVNARADIGGGVPISKLATEGVDSALRGMLIESVLKATGGPVDDFVVVSGGGVVATAKTFREATEIKTQKYPLGEVKANPRAAKKPMSRLLPWDKDPDVPEI